MNLPLFILAEAEQDVADAARWYALRGSGLEAKFLAEVTAALNRISANPGLHPFVRQNIRVSRLRRFPYVVYVRALEDCVEVFAILHGSRDPNVWRTRE